MRSPFFTEYLDVSYSKCVILRIIDLENDFSEIKIE